MVKNNKEKIFELKIEENDDLSGIDSISLVDSPAIEVNWIAFKKETEHSFEQDDVFVKHLMDKGDTEEDMFNDGWSIESMEILDGKQGFANTFPNQPSFEDREEYRVRYKYILNPKITGQPAIIPTSRHFCRELIAQNKVWRVEDIEDAVNDFGESPLVYRGSFNCRHVWSRIKYKKTGEIINKASVNKDKVMVGGFPNDLVPDVHVLGYNEPSTVTNKTLANPKPSTVKNLGLSKEGFDFPPAQGLNDKPKISLDYDGVLSTPDGEDLAKELVAQGNDVYVVTGRNELEGGVINELAKKLRIPTTNVIYTNGKSKAPILKALGITKHYDNNPDVIADIKKNAPNVEAIQFDYDVAGLPAYVDQVPRKKNKVIPKSIATSKEFLEQFDKINFASHNDYPQEVKDVAKRVLKWVDENGWGSCGTDVGKQRANQLANGEPLSESTIHRMYSYLSRHKGDLKSSKSYDDGCGKLMYDSWGGEPALQWAERKIQILNKHRMEKQKFATDEEKHIVLGPCMIPNEKIYRRDDQGNPYYVFFSPETIQMIADKYMRNKYIDNNDENHDGEAIKDVYVLESWIKQSNNDKSTDYGYENLPVGTWFVSMKVNNPDVWAKVKDGQLNGFSVSGYFSEVAQFTREEMFLYKVAEVLKKIKE